MLPFGWNRTLGFIDMALNVLVIIVLFIVLAYKIIACKLVDCVGWFVTLYHCHDFITCLDAWHLTIALVIVLKWILYCFIKDWEAHYISMLNVCEFL